MNYFPQVLYPIPQEIQIDLPKRIALNFVYDSPTHYLIEVGQEKNGQFQTTPISNYARTTPQKIPSFKKSSSNKSNKGPREILEEIAQNQLPSLFNGSLKDVDIFIQEIPYKPSPDY